MTTMLPKISVVTPSLNYEKYIEDAILSVAEQQYPNFEHIIVDGCSRDGTLAVLRKYPHLRWISEPDMGQSDALNKGFRMATGTLVGWLNADEYYLPGALRAVAECATANRSADVIYADSIDVDETGLIQGSGTAHTFHYPTLLYYGCFILSDATFFRRRLFEEGFLLDVDYRIVMDFEFFVRLAHAGKKFKYMKRFVGAFRQHGLNMASVHPEMRRRERLRTQDLYSSINLPDCGYDTLADVYRAGRILLKILNGNYARQLKVLRFAGSETRWFRGDEGGRICAAVLA